VIQNNCKKNKGTEPYEWIFDFGIRKISNQNFSKIVTLPKTLLKNYRGEEAKNVKILFVKNNEEQFFKLIPILRVTILFFSKFFINFS